MSAESQGRTAADQFRSQHHLDSAPIDDVVSLLDLVDIDAVLVDAGNDEHGLTARDTQTNITVIVANSALSSVRFRSTIAHELGHHVFDDDLTATAEHAYTSHSETRAHAFARHLLFPLSAAKAARAENPQFTDEQLLNWCVRRYGVSPQIAAYQLKNAGLIDSATCDTFAALSTGTLAWRYGWSDLAKSRDHAVTLHRTPRRLHEQATNAYLAGRLPLTEFAALTGNSVQEILHSLPPPAAPEASPSPDEAPTGDDDLSDLP